MRTRIGASEIGSEHDVRAICVLAPINRIGALRQKLLNIAGPVRLSRLACTVCLAAMSLLSIDSSLLGGDNDWTRFRGPNGSGVRNDCSVKLPWTTDRVTTVKLPGVGNGSPVIVGNFAYLLSANADDATRYLVAIDLEKGKTAWTKSFPSTKHRLHQFSSYASGTPCADDQAIYVAWGEPEHLFVKAFSFSGEELWSRDLGRYVSQHGFGSSPILVDDKVILLNSQDAQELEPGVEPGTDTMIAFDRRTGKTVWESPLPPTRVCYGVPAIRKEGSVTQLICSTTAKGIFAMDASTGKELWNHDCFTQRVCSSLLLVGDIAISTHGSGGGRDNRLVAYDIAKKTERFRINRAAPYVPTPVEHDGKLYLWADAGIASCVDMNEGKVLWTERIGGDYSSSPVIVGNLLMNTSHTGTVTFVGLGDKFKKVATVELGQTVRSTPAITNDKILLRTDSELLIIR